MNIQVNDSVWYVEYRCTLPFR